MSNTITNKDEGEDKIALYILVDRNKIWEYIVDYVCHDLGYGYKTQYHHKSGFTVESTFNYQSPPTVHVDMAAASMLFVPGNAHLLKISSTDTSDTTLLFKVIEKIIAIMNNEEINKTFLKSERQFTFRQWNDLGFSFTKSGYSDGGLKKRRRTE